MEAWRLDGPLRGGKRDEPGEAKRNEEEEADLRKARLQNQVRIPSRPRDDFVTRAMCHALDVSHPTVRPGSKRLSSDTPHLSQS